MDELWTRIWHDLIARMDGPFHLRFIFQPLMAMIFAIRDGVKDAHEGRPAYFWSLCTEPSFRKERIRDGWKSMSRVVIVATAMDLIYQVIEFRTIHPGETILTVAALAVLPYVLLRGPIKRLASAFMHRKLVERPHH